MGRLNICLPLFVILCGMGQASATNYSQSVQDKIREVESRNPRLTSIGSYAGKVYFVEPGNVPYPSQAHDKCRANFLQPVTFESDAEVAYVQSRIAATQAVQARFWTGAIDNREFSWHDGRPITVTWSMHAKLCDSGLWIRAENLALYRGYSGYPSTQTMCQTP